MAEHILKKNGSLVKLIVTKIRINLLFQIKEQENIKNFLCRTKELKQKLSGVDNIFI